MNEAENEKEVLDIITVHPLRSEQIACRLCISTGEVNAAVLALRSRGIPICGDDAHDGYYYGCPAELKRTISLLKWQRKLMDLAVTQLEKRLEENDSIRKSDT